MGRVDPTPKQRQRLYDANANRCCVSKRNDVGLHIHHIDEDSSNSIDENLAVLCVEDHDRTTGPPPIE
jgi:5-methylcytosine-specific restriction endonuclease McrA